MNSKNLLFSNLLRDCLKLLSSVGFVKNMQHWGGKQANLLKQFLEANEIVSETGVRDKITIEMVDLNLATRNLSKFQHTVKTTLNQAYEQNPDMDPPDY